MKCAGCGYVLRVGDPFLEATASEIIGGSSELDGLLADVLGSGNGEKLVYCEDCTEEGGRFRMSTYYGEDADG